MCFRLFINCTFCGIEMYNIELLIVPYGIETGVTNSLLTKSINYNCFLSYQLYVILH